MSDMQFSTWEDAVGWLRQQPDRQALVRDAYYDDHLRAAAERYWNSEEWREIRQRAGPGHARAALDVGAGRGIASYALARDGFAVTALEPDSSALVGAAAIRSLAAEAGLAIDVVEQYSERLPFADASFDVVFARAVLHRTSDLAAAAREFHRVLKPGGRLIAVREHVISRREDLPAFFALHPLHNLYGGENAFLLPEYRAALTGAGFRMAEELAPLESPINYAPHDEAALKDEVARKFPASKAVRGVLGLPGAWPLARAVIGRIDNRPGRLYSFICDRE